MDDEVKQLREVVTELRNSIRDLQSDVRNVATHVSYIKKEREEANKRWWNIGLAGLSALIVAIVVWITGGGLDGK